MFPALNDRHWLDDANWLRAQRDKGTPPSRIARNFGVTGAEVIAGESENIAKDIAVKGGEKFTLGRTEFEILALLLRNVGIVLERGVMYERIWGYDFDGASRSLDVHVGYLRRKLEASGADRMIETVRGIGFVLRP